MVTRRPLRRSARWALLMGLCACDGGTGLDDFLAGTWTVHLEYVGTGVETYSEGHISRTRRSCVGSVPATFYSDGTGTSYVVELSEAPDICETALSVQEPPGEEVTYSVFTSDFRVFGNLDATRDGNDIALSNVDGSLTFAGTLTSSLGRALVSNGSIGGYSKPDPLTDTYSYEWSAEGSWGMTR